MNADERAKLVAHLVQLAAHVYELAQARVLDAPDVWDALDQASELIDAAADELAAEPEKE